ncbi:hypothetical protein niasHT_003380 [Heterodera trifolii]|uniref:BTB domain-containing protein n=1 Tax=Heterodera trifolii TaxID=157864 RepID=A0ABD2LNN9_9BILA
MYEPSLVERMKHLLRTGEHADVYFLLVPAHKLILRSASEVFEAMFRFDAKKEKAEFASANCPVEVPDVEAAAFKVMLSFIYTEELSELNGDNSMGVLYAAKKYNIPGLFNPCLDVPVSELRNVFLAYAQACLFDLKDFAHDCLIFIDKNVETLIKSEEFLQIDQKLLCQILERDELQIPENRRQMLGPALLKIRFPLFSKEEFLKKIVPSQVLTAEEKIGVYQLLPTDFSRKLFSFILPIEISESLANLDIWDNFDEHRRNVGICKRTNEKLQIQGFLDGVENSVGKFYDHVFNTKQHGYGFNFEFAELMEPSKGFYDQNGDKITVTIDFTVGEAKADKSIYDSSKSHETLFMDIEKMSEFAREIILSERKSESVTYINELSWKILAKISQRTESNDNNEKWLGISLQCAAPKEDINWSCKCSAIVRIVSQKCDVADFKLELNGDVFDNKMNNWGFFHFISFAELMDPEKGFYDQSEDKCIVSVQSAQITRVNEAQYHFECCCFNVGHIHNRAISRD